MTPSAFGLKRARTSFSPSPCGEVEIASANSGGGRSGNTATPTRNLLCCARKFRPPRKGEAGQRRNPQFVLIGTIPHWLHPYSSPNRQAIERRERHARYSVDR